MTIGKYGLPIVRIDDAAYLKLLSKLGGRSAS